MQVKKSELIRLLTGLGHSAAAQWTRRQLEQKINGRGGVLAFREVGFRPTRQTDGLLLSRIAAEQAHGNIVTVIDDEKKDTKKAATPVSQRKRGRRPRGRPKKGGRKNRDILPHHFKPSGQPVLGAPSWVWDYYYRKNPLDVTQSGPETKRVYDELVHAAKVNDPVSKESLLGILRAYLPTKNPAKMRVFLSSLIPGKLRNKYGIHVWRTRLPTGEWGYWIPGDGKTPQPRPQKIS